MNSHVVGDSTLPLPAYACICNVRARVDLSAEVMAKLPVSLLPVFSQVLPDSRPDLGDAAGSSLFNLRSSHSRNVGIESNAPGFYRVGGLEAMSTRSEDLSTFLTYMRGHQLQAAGLEARRLALKADTRARASLFEISTALAGRKTGSSNLSTWVEGRLKRAGFKVPVPTLEPPKARTVEERVAATQTKWAKRADAHVRRLLDRPDIEDTDELDGIEWRGERAIGHW